MKTAKTLTTVILITMMIASSAFADRNRGGDRGGRDHGRRGGTSTIGKVLAVAAGLYLVSRIDRSPCQQQPYYQPPVYGGGYTGGYARSYDVPCVVENQNNRVIVNRPYQPGTQLTVLGQWVTDPNTQQPLYRRDQGTLVVSQSNGITSLCTVARGGAGRGDEITIAQPVMDPVATGY